MIIVISPAKTLDFESPSITSEFTIPESLDRSESIIKKLRTISRKKLSELMGISNDLSTLNVQRYIDWTPDFNDGNSKIAIQAFRGDVYVGLNVGSFTPEDVDFAQSHLRILSGLHGILKPLDLIKPYRLEMGTRLPVGRKKSLYEFWSDEVTRRINEELRQSQSGILLNLASDEYFNVIKSSKIEANIVKPVFKEYKNGEYKVISFLAKKARGVMSAYIIKNRILSVDDIKGFDEEGYVYNPELSNASEWIFTRDNKK